MKKNNNNSLFRRIPKVDQFLARPAVAVWIQRVGHEFVVSEIQSLLNEVRNGIRKDPAGAAEAAGAERLERFLSERLQIRLIPGLRYEARFLRTPACIERANTGFEHILAVYGSQAG